MKTLYAALALRKRYLDGQVSDHGLAIARGHLTNQLQALATPIQRTRANDRLARHLLKHLPQWFTFLFVPELDATNWRAELAIRFGVILRKVWGGNRTSLLVTALVVAGLLGVGGLEDLPSEAGRVLLLVFVILAVRYFLGHSLRPSC